MNEIVYYEDGEHRCELLIRIIQSREGNPSKEERELAFTELLEMFRPLIKSIAVKVYRNFKRTIRVDYHSFYHDTVTTAIEMILTDYIPKKNGGKSMFAPYLQTKLFYRTLYRAQRITKLYEQELPHPEFDKISEKIKTNDISSNSISRDSIHSQIDTAVLSLITERSPSVFDVYHNEQIKIRLEKLNSLAKKNLTDSEYFIWYGILYSSMNMNEIATTLNENIDPEERPWTKQRVYSTYHKVRMKVLSVYGEVTLSGEV